MGGLLLACAWIVPAAAHADRLEEIQARGSLICATLASNDPGLPRSADRPDRRFRCGHVQRHCSQAGCEDAPAQFDRGGRLPALIQGEVDWSGAGLYPRAGAPDRFRRRITDSDQAARVQSDSGLNLVSDLEGKRISANRGSTPEQAVRRVLRKATC
jgi:polar amino acid transport system substrate-binding protein